MLQHLNQHRTRRFCDTNANKTRTAKGSQCQLFTTSLKFNLLEVLEFNLPNRKKNIPRKRRHHPHGVTSKIERLFFKNNRNRIVIWNASRARRSNDSEQKEKAARSNSTPLNVYYCFRLVNEKSLFEGAHKCQKRKTLNHFGCDTYSFSVFFFSGEGNMACLKREKNPATCLRQCHAFHVSTVALPTAKNYFTNFPHSERWKKYSKKFTMAFLIYSISPWSEASGGKKNNCCDCALALGWVSVTCNYVIFSLSPHELMLLTSMLSAEWERITFHFFISFLFKQKSEFDWHKANGLRLSQKNRWWKNKIKWGKRSREEIELDQMITPMMTRDALVKKLSTSSAVESKNRYYNSLARQLLDSLMLFSFFLHFIRPRHRLECEQIAKAILIF